MKAKDLMEPLGHWLTPEMTIQQAIREMRQAKRGHGLSVNGMVVLDHDQRLVGMVSTLDIIRIVIPSGVYIDEEHSGIPWESLSMDRTEQIKNVKVDTIMTEEVLVVHAHDTILRCADVMLVQQVRRLPVLGDSGVVTGIVYLRDVYNALTELLCEYDAEAAV
jgi:CBS domain-containing protein